MVRDLERTQQAQRRSKRVPKWRLDESPKGKVPKDLVTMFAGIPTPQIPNPPRPFLTDGELGALREVLGFIDRHGGRKLLRVTQIEGEATPATEKVKSAKSPSIASRP